MGSSPTKGTINIEMTTSKIFFKNEVVEISWSNTRALEELLKYQKSASIEISTRLVQFKIDYFLKNNIIEKDQHILDIGSGIGLEDLFLQKYTGNNFYLLDKDENTLSSDYKFFDSNYAFYNNKECTLDAIKTSNLDINKFKFLTPEDPWDISFDVIMSNSSWCWHYPFETYWEKVKQHLKTGGKLYIDISHQALRNTPNLIKIISEELRSTPQISFYKNHHVESDFLIWKDGYFGIAALWSKQ